MNDYNEQDDFNFEGDTPPHGTRVTEETEKFPLWQHPVLLMGVFIVVVLLLVFMAFRSGANSVDPIMIEVPVVETVEVQVTREIVITATPMATVEATATQPPTFTPAPTIASTSTPVPVTPKDSQPATPAG